MQHTIMDRTIGGNADSENPREWSKADITQDKFREFVSDMAKKFEDVN